MSILHTVNKSPFERNSLESCLKFAAEGASVLLFEDGVYAALAGTSIESQVTAALGKLKLYVLGPDLKARGFSDERVIPGIRILDYAGFVDLAAECDKVQAWL
ncbi:sulfurtransferase complex subunit TusB [Thermochromatium tepidum]|jgi:sulfur relay protein TusB/DsrH|uniref:Sulfurtransferase complex subunit TusB n=1 Tax=Thermochromatium tepidum ATCC 43061 TaxID=316276 RepID=A0A6I6E918_THETI|nr:sulfurtransferase complex subunit TusB [Thermochromatium tepidum]QGU33163.1 sulfurtransferase complex subunit TusB [Thermochromatium tepidum ATCC 43061]